MVLPCFGSACIELFCFGVIGNLYDPILDGSSLDDFPRKSYEYVFAQYATLSECAVCRNFVLKLSLRSHVNSFSLRTS